MTLDGPLSKMLLGRTVELFDGQPTLKILAAATGVLPSTLVEIKTISGRLTYNDFQ
ncbi:MAG TPA: hypothetical protein VGC80_18550 [Acetobacteraceae bacterium]